MALTDPMTDIARIAAGLTKAQREAVIRGQSEFVSMPVSMWSVLRRLCWSTSRRGCVFEEGLIGVLVLFRLTPLGLAVRHHIQGTTDDE